MLTASTWSRSGRHRPIPGILGRTPQSTMQGAKVTCSRWQAAAFPVFKKHYEASCESSTVAKSQRLSAIPNTASKPPAQTGISGQSNMANELEIIRNF